MTVNWNSSLLECAARPRALEHVRIRYAATRRLVRVRRVPPSNFTFTKHLGSNGPLVRSAAVTGTQTSGFSNRRYVLYT